VDLSGAWAQWIDRWTLVWGADPGQRAWCAIAYSADASLRVVDGELKGGARVIRTGAAGPLPGGAPDLFPHLAGRPVYRIDPRDIGLVPEAVRCQVVATLRDPGGRLVAASGVQLAGVLDDLYGAAVHEDLGPTWSGGIPRLAVWAPTARTVELVLYETAGAPEGRTVPMHRDDSTGVWWVLGDHAWRGRYYTYRVTVYAPDQGRLVVNDVTDPYSLSLAADSVRSQIVDLDDPALAPEGRRDMVALPPVRADRATIYELHVRDFSAADGSVPPELRGTYAAFTLPGSDGMKALKGLAEDGLTHVQLMPIADFAATPERRADRTPSPDLRGLPPDSPEQQERVRRVSGGDAYDWGYDTLHWTTPEGSYATDPEGWARIRDVRAMIAALHHIGLRVVLDVAYNHSHAAGSGPGSVLDRVVPGYYHRLRDDGSVDRGTGCPDTAPEHAMMGKLVIDSMTTWARQYRVDGFRVDLMGFHPKANMLAVRAALDALTSARDGVDGRAILLYGEGWSLGDVAGDARFVQATQENLAGTGIGTFNDRIRDALRGGGVLDADPRVQGLGSGLWTAPNGAPVNGPPDAQLERLRAYQDVVGAALAGFLRGDGRPGYAAEPGEAIAYADAHDNETLYDALAHKLPPGTPMADRVRMHVLTLAVVLLCQGPAFLLAGTERLRSKSLDRNSYNSGDWFNRLFWDAADGNGFGSGLPPEPDNGALWPYDAVLLRDRALCPDAAAIRDARTRFGRFLRIRSSTPAFALGDAAEIRRRITVGLPGAADPPGVVTVRIDTTGLDRRWRSVLVIVNATPETWTGTYAGLAGARLAVHPLLESTAEAYDGATGFDPGSGTLRVPPRTVTVLVEAHERLP